MPVPHAVSGKRAVGDRGAEAQSDSYGTWLGENKPPTVRDQLDGLIDTALGQGCKDFDSLLTAIKAAVL